MDADELRASHAEAKARSQVLLDPEAYRVAVAEEAAQHVVHRDDGYSCDWAAGMPSKAEPAPAPPRTFTDSEISRMFAELPRALTSDEVKQIARDEIASTLRGPDGLIEGIAATFASRKLFKELRSKIAGLTLRLDGLMHEQNKRRQIIAADIEHREAEVVSLLRSKRRA